MRRVHLRGHENILKRYLIHIAGLNLGLVMRHMLGVGSPKGLAGRLAALLHWIACMMIALGHKLSLKSLLQGVRPTPGARLTLAACDGPGATFSTGC